MCVSQFRDYCKASRFKHDNRRVDMNDKSLEVRQETFRYADRSYYYVTDLNEMNKLAKSGNEYALKHLEP